MRYTTYKLFIYLEVKLLAPAGIDVGLFRMNFMNTMADGVFAACQNMNRREIGYVRYTGPFLP